MDYLDRRSKANSVIDELMGKQSTKRGFWNHVEEMLAFLYDMYPEAMIEHEEVCKARRDLAINDWNENKDQQRLRGAPPYKLVHLIQRIYGEDIPYPNMSAMWNEFFKRFPQFSFAKKDQ